MSATTNPLFGSHVDLLWSELIPEFGRVVSYLPDSDPVRAAPVELIWIEGVEDEAISPGRYSHVLVRNASLPAPPTQRDCIENEGIVYEVVRVNAFAYAYARLILQEAR